MVEKLPLISKIQKYSTKDGPGIRTTVFFLGCNLQCKWCSNPELISGKQQLLYYQNKCLLCGYCVKKNPKVVRIEKDRLQINRENSQAIMEVATSCPNEAYEVIGHHYTPEELSRNLLRDEVFYRQSSGGVTFSGGEPALYPSYLLAVSKYLKVKNIHLALDTAGLWDYDDLEQLLGQIDLVLFDLKTYDKNLHKKLTGVSNEIIITNLLKLREAGKDITVRLVLIPGQNDDIKDLKQRLDLITSLAIEKVEVLFYHNLAIGKYQALSKEYALIDTELYSEERKKVVKELVSQYNLSATYNE